MSRSTGLLWRALRDLVPRPLAEATTSGGCGAEGAQLAWVLPLREVATPCGTFSPLPAGPWWQQRRWMAVPKKKVTSHHSEYVALVFLGTRAQPGLWFCLSCNGLRQ